MKTSQLIYILIATVFCFSCGGEKTNENTEFDFKSEGYAQYDNEQGNYNQNGNGQRNANYNQNNGQQNGNWQQNGNEQENGNYNQNGNRQQNANYQGNNNQQQRSTSNGLKPYKIMSPQFGMPFGIMPIPQSWNKKGQNQENILFESANGVKVYNEQYVSFSHYNDPQRSQFAQQNGENVQPIKSLERVINEDFKPYLQKEGVTFVRQYPLPQLAQSDKRIDSYMYKATPENKQYQCMVTEWKDQKGNLSLGVVRYFVTQYPNIGGMSWGYTINSMEAPQGVYQNAKQEVIYALLNLQINPQWVKANNQHYSKMAQQSNAGHRARMAAIEATGRAIRQNGKAYSDMADSSHESWKRRNAISDRGQANAVDAIWDRRNMTDGSGNTYKVEGYDNNVWMNGSNEYIGTNNPNWNPNIDNGTNNQNWEQLQNSNGGGY